MLRSCEDKINNNDTCERENEMRRSPTRFPFEDGIRNGLRAKCAILAATNGTCLRNDSAVFIRASFEQQAAANPNQL